MTLVTDIGRPPVSYDAEAWLDFLLVQPSRHNAIQGVIEEYPHVLDCIIDWAMSQRDKTEHKAEQAAKHLAEPDLTVAAKAFWTGFQHAVDPFACLPAPDPEHHYTWQPGDPF